MEVVRLTGTGNVFPGSRPEPRSPQRSTECADVLLSAGFTDYRSVPHRTKSVQTEMRKNSQVNTLGV